MSSCKLTFFDALDPMDDFIYCHACLKDVRMIDHSYINGVVTMMWTGMCGIKFELRIEKYGATKYTQIEKCSVDL